MTTERFYVDERCGCIAIRDRTLTDPEYPGLHQDTPGVVWYRHGLTKWRTCPECGHTTGRLEVSAKHKAAAILECARLNAVYATSPEVEQVWGNGP